VHRLDGPVAGLVVLARTSKAAARLSAQFREKTVTKQYLAVVEGCPPEQSLRLENHLVRKGRFSRIVHEAMPGSQMAVLTYRLLERQAGHALLQITLESGRRHQIRAQLAQLGCPVAGDTNYGAVKALPQGRIALLAYRLAFDHPTRRERLEFETLPPLGWPWPRPGDQGRNPLWTIEAYEQAGLLLPTDGPAD
jgi:23S rRNA pseudouridine1911/1915/1917 synthase